MLLQAAYHDPLLQNSIDKDNLRVLVVKTLNFLREVADQRSALRKDIKLLEFAARKMGFL
jgi:chemotaxis regulatin CheY-phosphate phosphatase CheZ